MRTAFRTWLIIAVICAAAPLSATTLTVLGTASAPPPKVWKEAWQVLLPHYRADLAAMRDCLADEAACVTAELRTWREEVANVGAALSPAAIRQVNRAVNRRPYVEDGWPQIWRPPLMTLREGGDCEDYVIAKMFSLIALGAEPDRLSLLVLTPRHGQAPHAVLLVEDAAGGFHVLDNRTDHVRSGPVEDFAPGYEFAASFFADGRVIGHAPRPVRQGAKLRRRID